jgi:DNA-binding response OmpR family regulator
MPASRARRRISNGHSATSWSAPLFRFDIKHSRIDHRRSMRILVVEPDAAVRHFVDIVLTRLGFDTLVAATPGQAEALLLDFPSPLQVALLDVTVSPSRGLAYGDDLRRRYPAASLIFMSSWHSVNGSAEARARGRLLYKPLYAQELVDAIRQASEGHAR